MKFLKGWPVVKIRNVACSKVGGKFKDISEFGLPHVEVYRFSSSIYSNNYSKFLLVVQHFPKKLSSQSWLRTVQLDTVQYVLICMVWYLTGQYNAYSRLNWELFNFGAVSHSFYGIHSADAPCEKNFASQPTDCTA